MSSASGVLLAEVVRRINQAFDLNIRAQNLPGLARALVDEAVKSGEIMGFVSNLGAPGSSTLTALLKGLDGGEEIRRTLVGVSEGRRLQMAKELQVLEGELARVTGDRNRFNGSKSINEVKEKVKQYLKGEKLGAVRKMRDALSYQDTGAIQGFLGRLEAEEDKETLRRLASNNKDKDSASKRSTQSNVSPTGAMKFDTRKADEYDRFSVSMAKNEKERKLLQEIMMLKLKRREEVLLPLAALHRAIQESQRAGGGGKEVAMLRAKARQLNGELDKVDKELSRAMWEHTKEMKLNANLPDVKSRFGRKVLDTAHMSQTEVQRSREENAERARRLAGGGAEGNWDWIITSGKYRGKTLRWLFEHRRDYFIQAHNQDGRGWSLLGSRDRGKLDQLVAGSRELREMMEEYWEDGGGLSPQDATLFSGWSKRDGRDRRQKGERMKMNMERKKTRESWRGSEETKKYEMRLNERTGKYEMMRSKEDTGEWVSVNDGVGTPRSKLRGEKTNDPEARDSMDRADVRRDLFGEAWQQARRKYNEFGQWKQTRRNGEKGWKRRNPVTGRMEFKRRNPEGWRLNEFYETQQAMAEWKVKFERAQEVIKYRDMAAGKRGDREQTIDEVEKEMGKMGDVVELHVKKKKLEYMMDKGYLKGEQALIGKEYEGMSRAERDVVRKEAMMARDMEDRKGSVEDGRTGGQMGRDRLEREGAIGKDDVPLWQRIEEAGSEGELEKLQEEIYGEFGEVNVRRIEQGEDKGVDGGWGIGKLMQEKRNVLRAASSS